MSCFHFLLRCLENWLTSTYFYFQYCTIDLSDIDYIHKKVKCSFSMGVICVFYALVAKALLPKLYSVLFSTSFLLEELPRHIFSNSQNWLLSLLFIKPFLHYMFLVTNSFDSYNLSNQRILNLAVWSFRMIRVH